MIKKSRNVEKREKNEIITVLKSKKKKKKKGEGEKGESINKSNLGSTHL